MRASHTVYKASISGNNGRLSSGSVASHNFRDIPLFDRRDRLQSGGLKQSERVPEEPPILLTRLGLLGTRAA